MYKCGECIYGRMVRKLVYNLTHQDINRELKQKVLFLCIDVVMIMMQIKKMQAYFAASKNWDRGSEGIWKKCNDYLLQH